jgi:hypothetical protein
MLLLDTNDLEILTFSQVGPKSRLCDQGFTVQRTLYRRVRVEPLYHVSGGIDSAVRSNNVRRTNEDDCRDSRLHGYSPI